MSFPSVPNTLTGVTSWIVTGALVGLVMLGFLVILLRTSSLRSARKPAMQLFNTMTQRTEQFKFRKDTVTLYVCGVTPYDTTHLGHAFVNVVFDTLVRTIRWYGQSIRYVQNVTDIDDSILRKAQQVQVAWDELGRRETKGYLADLRALNVTMPDYFIRASDETAQMIHLIEALLAKGHAYINEGCVYFRVRSDPGFGQLAKANGYPDYASWLTAANERGNFPEDPRKEDPLDFVLWQTQQPGEPAWPSPWGPGRPGWHIECSAMSSKYLGTRIVLHGGGADLIFPHHTCEIAQSENATDQHPFVRIWMHTAMVHQDGQKMSKSLGNLTRVSDLLTTYSPDAVRLLLLSHHYRDVWEYDPKNATEMQRWAMVAERLWRASLAEVKSPARPVKLGRDVRRDRTAFQMALADDLNTPRAVATLEALADRVFTGKAGPGGASTLRELAKVLGLQLNAYAS